MYSQKLTDINCVNGADFRKDYVRFCFKFQLCPVRCIKKLNVNGTSLDCFIDAISSEHLLPLLNALAINKNLEAISLHSTFIEKFNQEMLNECRIYDLMQLREKDLSYKLPAVLRQELQTKLFTSLTNCISINKVLKQLEITGLPFTLNIMKQFSKAIESSNSLQYLSLAGCFIENEGLSVLCNSLKSNVSIKILNFSDCHITPVGMKSLTGFTKYQASMRHLSAWQGSLRYRQPILDSFPGVSRLILNDNESLGDVGAKILTEALSDDLWLKAIDLQNCGITSVGAKWLLNVLVQNTSIEILDMRRNPSIDNDISERIVAQLNLSNKGKVCEYEWLPSKKYCYCEPFTEIRKIKSTAKITSVQHQKPCSTSTAKFSNLKNKGEKTTRTSREKQLHPLASQEKQSETASTACSESKEIDEWMETCLQLRRELKLCLQQLEVEQGRRKLAELEIEQLKGEGKSTGLNNGYVVVDEAMLATIHDTFTKFRYFIDFLRASCYNFESEAKHNEMKEESLKYPSTVLNTEYNERHPGVPSVYNNSNSTIYTNPQVPSQSSLPPEHPFFIEDVDIPITTLPKPSSTDDLFNIISQRIHNTLSSSLTLPLAAAASSSLK